MYYTRARLMKYTDYELHNIWIKEGFPQWYLQNKSKEDIINFLLKHQQKQPCFFTKKIYKIVDKICDIHIYKNIETHPDILDIPEIEDEKCCVICEEFKKFFAGNCGHLALCGKCSKDIWNKNGLCPICRAPWKDIRKIYI